MRELMIALFLPIVFFVWLLGLAEALAIGEKIFVTVGVAAFIYWAWVNGLIPH
jgi:hypothetical protein